MLSESFGGLLQTSRVIPPCLSDIPSFYHHLHHCENISNDKSLMLADENEFSTEAGKVEKHCFVDMIYGNLFFLRKKHPIKRW